MTRVVERRRTSKSFGDFYRGKTVLVTGHTGFKGSWLTTWLTELGSRVVGYALEPPTLLAQRQKYRFRLWGGHVVDTDRCNRRRLATTPLTARYSVFRRSGNRFASALSG